MNQIYLKWATGEMKINLNEFFPAKAKDVKKLLELIRMDTQGEDHIAVLLNHLNDRLPDLENCMKEYSSKYLAAKQVAADYECRINSGMHPNGLPIMPDELKGIKAKYREAKWEAHTYEIGFNRCKQKKKQALRNVEQIKKAK